MRFDSVQQQQLTPLLLHSEAKTKQLAGVRQSNNNNNNNRFMAVCPGLPVWAGIRRNTHPPTILIIIQSLSASSIYHDPQHPPCSNCVLGNLFAQSLAASFLSHKQRHHNLACNFDKRRQTLTFFHCKTKRVTTLPCEISATLQLQTTAYSCWPAAALFCSASRNTSSSSFLCSSVSWLTSSWYHAGSVDWISNNNSIVLVLITTSCQNTTGPFQSHQRLEGNNKRPIRWVGWLVGV